MDPNAKLAELRALAKDAPLHASDDAWGSLDEIRAAFRDLDEWLSKGGFPPDAWLRAIDGADDDDDFAEALMDL